MHQSRRAFLIGHGSAALAASTGLALGRESAAVTTVREIVLRVEHVASGLHAIEIDQVKSLVTSAELQAIRAALPEVLVRGSPVVRSDFSLTNLSNANYMLAAASIEGMLLNSIGWKMDSGANWRLGSMIDGHPEGLSYQIPLLAGATKGFTWQLWHATMESVQTPGVGSTLSTTLMEYRVNSQAFLMAQRLLSDGLGERVDLAVTGAGRCLVTAEP